MKAVSNLCAKAVMLLLSPSVNRFYSTFHPAIGVDRDPNDMITGQEPLWINLGYWAGLETVNAENYQSVDTLLDNAQRAMARWLQIKLG